MAKDKTVQEMADELGLKKENVDFGLKKDNKSTSEAIRKAYAFKNKKRK